MVSVYLSHKALANAQCRVQDNMENTQVSWRTLKSIDVNTSFKDEVTNDKIPGFNYTSFHAH